MATGMSFIGTFDAAFATFFNGTVFDVVLAACCAVFEVIFAAGVAVFQVVFTAWQSSFARAFTSLDLVLATLLRLDLVFWAGSFTNPDWKPKRIAKPNVLTFRIFNVVFILVEI